MSTISIVTTSFNQAPFIEEMLESVRSQRCANVEHLVLDGASNDGTVSLLQSKTGDDWQHLRWTSEPDGGQPQAMNKGLRMATGEIIGWLNSDDRYRPGCLESVIEIFEQNPEVDIVYGDYTFIDEGGQLLRVRREISFSSFVLLYHRTLYIATTSCFFRRRIFDEGNWLDESMQYAMDHDFFVRLAARGYRFKHVSRLFGDYRLHSLSKTCSMTARFIAESQMTMYRYSPIALGVKNKSLRTFCLAIAQIAALLVRYTEKFFRGYYLPDNIIGRERPIR